MGSHSLEENNFVSDKIFGTVPVENTYKLVDSSGNVTVLTTGSGDQAKAVPTEQLVATDNWTPAKESQRYS